MRWVVPVALLALGVRPDGGLFLAFQSAALLLASGRGPSAAGAAHAEGARGVRAGAGLPRALCRGGAAGARDAFGHAVLVALRQHMGAGRLHRVGRPWLAGVSTWPPVGWWSSSAASGGSNCSRPRPRSSARYRAPSSSWRTRRTSGSSGSTTPPSCCRGWACARRRASGGSWRHGRASSRAERSPVGPRWCRRCCSPCSRFSRSRASTGPGFPPPLRPMPPVDGDSPGLRAPVHACASRRAVATGLAHRLRAQRLRPPPPAPPWRGRRWCSFPARGHAPPGGGPMGGVARTRSKGMPGSRSGGPGPGPGLRAEGCTRLRFVTRWTEGAHPRSNPGLHDPRRSAENPGRRGAGAVRGVVTRGCPRMVEGFPGRGRPGPRPP